MAEYIKKSDALGVLEHCAMWNRGLVTAFDEMQAIPAADVAPVVRCDECIHQENCMRQIVFWERDNVLEQNTSKYHKLDFCSYGEPKGERRSE